MKKQHLLLLITALVALASILWFNKAPSEAPKFHIGALIPLTGPSANFGEDDKNAIELAISHFSKEHPTLKITSEFQDTKGDKGEAVSGINALLSRQTPELLFVESSGATLAVIPIVNDKKITTLAVAAHPDATKNSPYVIRCLPTAQQESEIVLNHASRENQSKRISLITLNNDYGSSYIGPFQQLTEQLGLELLVVERYDPSATDYRNIATKVAATPTDTVFIVGYGAGMGILIRQLREQGFLNHIMATSGVIYPEVLREAGSSANGLQYADVPFRSRGRGDIALEFEKAYKAKYKKAPTPFASTVYDGTLIALGAWQECGKKDADSIIAQILKTREFSGANGRISVSQSRDIVFDLEINTIRQ